MPPLPDLPHIGVYQSPISRLTESSLIQPETPQSPLTPILRRKGGRKKRAPSDDEWRVLNFLDRPIHKSPTRQAIFVDEKLLDDQIKRMTDYTHDEESHFAPLDSPPKMHRGFGASANVFNADGSLEVGGN